MQSFYDLIIKSEDDTYKRYDRNIDLYKTKTIDFGTGT